MWWKAKKCKVNVWLETPNSAAGEKQIHGTGRNGLSQGSWTRKSQADIGRDQIRVLNSKRKTGGEIIADEVLRLQSVLSETSYCTWHGPLPEMRVMRSRPFQHTGVDFAGPLYVKTDEGRTKSYIALFTCATTRAVHLELTPDLTGPVFRMALEKFSAFWGMPNLMVSDNATTFKTTAVALDKLFEHPEVQAYLQSNFLT